MLAKRVLQLVGYLSVCALVMGLPAAADEPRDKPLDVPYEPTHPDVVEAMLEAAGVTDKDFVIDLGCGDGRIVIAAAKRGACGLGVDLDPQRVKEAKEGAEHAQVAERVEFREEDILQTDVRKATVVTLYLLPDVNMRLRPKLFAELKPGTRVVSHAFDMDDWEADRKIDAARARAKTVYYWMIPAGVGGNWTWKQEIGGKPEPAALALDQRFQMLNGELKLGEAAPVKITEARVQGEEVVIHATVPAAGAETKVVYRGTLEGDELKGTQEWTGGPNAGKQPWVATREPVKLAGKWRIECEAADCRGTLRIEQKDGVTQAHFKPQKGPERPVASFYVWGNSVLFDVERTAGPFSYFGHLAPDGGGVVSGGSLVKEQTWKAQPGGEHSARPDPTGGDVRSAWSPDKGPPKAGDAYVNAKDGSVLVWVVGGEFTMGRDEGPADERPAHKVKVEGFWLGRHEVTNRQFARYLEEQKGELPMFWEKSDYNQPDQPVVGVTYYEAQAYCTWAGLRLPSEAEWEYAAQGGGKGAAFATASGQIGPDLANLRGKAGKDTWDLPAPVGSFAPNPLGLYDLAGNAWEWTSSAFDAYPYVATDGREEQGGGLRVLRGGCWAFPADYARTTHRRRFSASLHYDYAGFRVAMSAAPATNQTARR